MSAFLLSTLVGAGIIFVAELGDKSQLMAMAFATRYKIRDVIIGLTVATAVVHLASVGIGYVIGDAFASYQSWIELVAGVAFIFFALWTLRGDELTDEERDKALSAKSFAPMVVVGLFFFLAELGDKTMLATITLAAQDESFAQSAGTWLGSTVGMVAADALAIVVGAVLGKKLPEKAVTVFATTLFVIFGVVLIVSGIRAM
ncbi:TMEM165/GDT1 family protein [Nocardioides yefusunii]|uniref:GDT1 family protein n=1 Tax=Nocardioides yefusunii TaxID=2500546 RepID=A0ABW1QUN5_9ACTN|nr:TMEM165/GDT1 family protein [Nocardioides yefusunii]